jgi:hypothetical protein
MSKTLKEMLLVGPRCEADYELIRSAGQGGCMTMVRLIRNEHRLDKNCLCWTCRMHPDL